MQKGDTKGRKEKESAMEVGGELWIVLCVIPSRVVCNRMLGAVSFKTLFHSPKQLSLRLSLAGPRGKLTIYGIKQHWAHQRRYQWDFFWWLKNAKTFRCTHTSIPRCHNCKTYRAQYYYNYFYYCSSYRVI